MRQEVIPPPLVGPTATNVMPVVTPTKGNLLPAHPVLKDLTLTIKVLKSLSDKDWLF